MELQVVVSCHMDAGSSSPERGFLLQCCNTGENSIGKVFSSQLTKRASLLIQPERGCLNQHSNLCSDEGSNFH